MEKDGRAVTSDPVLRQKIAQLWIDTESAQVHGRPRHHQAPQGELPGPEASAGKMGWVETSTRSCKSWPWRSRARTRSSPRGSDRAVDGGLWQYAFLRSRANSIEGGTTEIQKNIIGERVLGLPKG